MVRLIFIVLLSFFVFIAKANEIKKIEINGLSSLSRGTVLSYLPIEIGDDFNDSISDISIQKLFETGLFEDVKISQVEGILKIEVLENPVISYFEIKGFKNDRVLNEDAVKNSISDLKLSSGNLYRKRVFDQFLRKLRNEYEISGHYKAKFDIQIDKDEQNRIGIEIIIDEGEVARIKSLNISGNQKFDKDLLLDFFTIGMPDIFFINYFTDKDFFSQFEFDAGIQKIQSHYLESGFLDFKFNKKSVLISDNKEEINIDIELEEGKQYQFGKISLQGDYLNISEEKLNSLLNVKSGEFFERKKLILGLEAINTYYGNQGFAFASIDANTVENKESKLVDIDITINVNDRIYLNRIIITGNTRTTDEVIRREINLLEGQQYSKTELDKSIKNIKRLAFFKNVEMRSERLSDNSDKLNLFIEVDETKTGELSIGLSQSNTTGAAFNFGIQERNFLGTGNTLNAGLINSEAVKEATFFFSNPDFNGKKHTISYGASSRQVDSKFIDINAYTLNTLGINASYGIPISEYGKFSNGFIVESTELQCGAVYLIYEGTQCSDTTSKLNLNLISSIKENSLNDSMYPTDGRKNIIKIELGLPLSDQLIYKFDFGHSSYYPIGEDLTLKIGSDIGFIGTYDGSETPFYKKYFGGGASSLRGFNLNSLGPRYSDGSVKGGEISILGTSSIFSPLTFIENSDNMRIGTFVDVGSINESLDKFNLNDLRASTGLAFSWYTPIGPIGVNYSKPLISKSGDNLESFSFSLGASF